MELADAPTLAPGTRIGHYEIVRLIGRGGMGVVYEARDVRLDKRVAVKTLTPRTASSAEALARFVREAHATARIRHPNVVDVYDVGSHEGAAFLAMELLEGENLGDVIARRGALHVAELADLMLPVLAAVAAAHRAGVIHRDLKPDNLFLWRTPDGRLHPKVTDFGIARVLDDDARLTSSSAILGTPYYMSPEQACGAHDADARSDQYALGVILYEAATGTVPLEAGTALAVLHKIVDGTFPPPRAHRPDLPEAFEALVLRAMRYKPQDRFPDVEALATALLPFASDATRPSWTGPNPQALSVVELGLATTHAAPRATPREASQTTLDSSVNELAVPGLGRRRRRGVGAIAMVGSALLVVGASIAALGSRDRPPAAPPPAASLAQPPPGPTVGAAPMPSTPMEAPRATEASTVTSLVAQGVAAPAPSVAAAPGPPAAPPPPRAAGSPPAPARPARPAAPAPHASSVASTPQPTARPDPPPSPPTAPAPPAPPPPVRTFNRAPIVE